MSGGERSPGRLPVVVGVDASEESRSAAALGHAIAEASGAPLHLVAAVHDPLVDIGIARLGFDATAVRDALVKSVSDGVRVRLQGAVPSDGLDTALTGVVGRPEHVLAEFSRKVGAGLILLGGKARAGARRRIARHLLRTAGCPLLVTGPAADEITTVLAALDSSGSAPSVVRVATWLARTLKAELRAVHVVDDTVPRVPRMLALDADRMLEEGRARANEEIWPLLAPEVPRELETGPVAESLIRRSREGGPHLVVLGTHGLGRINRWLIGSTADALLGELPTSLAIVPSDPSWA